MEEGGIGRNQCKTQAPKTAILHPNEAQEGLLLNSLSILNSPQDQLFHPLNCLPRRLVAP